MFGFGRKQEDHNVQTLSDITRGIQHSVNTAQEMVERHYIQMLDRYFKPDRTPFTVKVKIAEGHEMEVPLIALINPSGLSLSEMSVEMSLRVDETLKKTAKSLSGKPALLSADGSPDDLQRSSFSISLAPPSGKDKGRASNVIDVVMKFTAGDPPEGIARIIDEFTSKILPRESKPGGETPPDKGETTTGGEEGQNKS